MVRYWVLICNRGRSWGSNCWGVMLYLVMKENSEGDE